MKSVFGLILLMVSFVLVPQGTGAEAEGADYLKWDKTNNVVSAAVTTWDVTAVLRHVAAATGWEVYLEPGTQQLLHTRFKNLSSGEALSRMLGPLNFALLPREKGHSRLLVFRTSQTDATERIKPAEAKGKAIEDELVVTLKPGEKIEELARKLGAKVIGKADGLNAYRLKFDDAAAAQSARSALLSNPAVAAVDSNYWMNRPPGTDLLGAVGTPPLLPTARTDGKNVIVGLVDSLVQAKEGRVSDLVLPGISVTGDTTTSSSTTTAGDSPTHGTAMAETIIKSLAELRSGSGSTTMRILPVDVYGNSESTSTFDVAKGIYEAINRGATIINLSLGSDGNAQYLQDVITSGHNQGVIFLAAAGNEPVTTPTYPAAYPGVIAVTAETSSGQIADYANRGTFVNAGAPDQSVVVFNNQAYLVTGTSVSTAFASGLAAGLKENSGQSLADVEAALRKALALRVAGPAGAAKP